MYSVVSSWIFCKHFCCKVRRVRNNRSDLPKLHGLLRRAVHTARFAMHRHGDAGYQRLSNMYNALCTRILRGDAQRRARVQWHWISRSRSLPDSLSLFCPLSLFLSRFSSSTLSFSLSFSLSFAHSYFPSLPFSCPLLLFLTTFLSFILVLSLLLSLFLSLSLSLGSFLSLLFSHSCPFSKSQLLLLNYHFSHLLLRLRKYYSSASTSEPLDLLDIYYQPAIRVSFAFLASCSSTLSYTLSSTCTTF